jgi:serine/threonine-protein kinase
VIHRDLKPSNIILDRAGRPYLTDFGLGKQMEKPSQLSVPGIALGTLDYMAPEQFTGSGDPALANRIDVYAMGCVIYACLAGRPPFVKDTPEQLMYAHNHESPAPARSIRPELPQAVDAVLAKSLAKDPKDRYGTATELVAALEAAFTSGIGQTRPIPLPPGGSGVRGFLRGNMPFAIIGASLAVVGSVVLAALLLGGPGPSPRPSDIGRATTVPTPSVRPTGTPVPTATLPPATPVAGAFPNPQEATLMSRLGPEVATAATCLRFPIPADYSSIAMVSCEPPILDPPVDSDQRVIYGLYATQASLEDEYRGQMDLYDVVMDEGDCEDGDLPADLEWGFGGVFDDGRLACFTDDEDIRFVWTHFAKRIHSQWIAPDHVEGYRLWKEWTGLVGG